MSQIPPERTLPILLSETGQESLIDTRGTWKTIDEMSINYKGIKSHCEYCLSNSYDDERGNCICCGAPRQKGIQFEYRLTPDVWCSTAYDDDLLASS
jgi:ribosomal protein L37E